ncbi:MAG: precorrin-6A reductase [Methanobacteriota archaeon]
MIWVLSGTKDAVEIIKLLKKEKYRVLASAVTNYGASLARDAGADEVVAKALDCNEMRDMLHKKNIEAVVDAAHPFAVDASKNAIRACTDSHVKYIRFERENTNIPSDERIYIAKDFGDAAKKATKFETIFYTAGSKNLELFLNEARKKKKRIVVRVLPDTMVIKRCIELGIEPVDIIAMQGPFSIELNKAMMREYSASVLVTKESGEVGGTESKIRAALDLDMPVILIERPKLDYDLVVQDYEEVLKEVKE